MIDRLRRVCVKLYATKAEVMDDVFVPIFHEWIRERSHEGVLIDVADYTHAPNSPGVMLIGHETSYSLDRTDERFGLLAQRRTSSNGTTTGAITSALRGVLSVAARLETDARVAGKLVFGRNLVRIEANDRLNAPNTAAAFDGLAPRVRSVVAAVWPGSSTTIARVVNDPRDRLALEVVIVSEANRETAQREQNIRA